MLTLETILYNENSHLEDFLAGKNPAKDLALTGHNPRARRQRGQEEDRVMSPLSFPQQVRVISLLTEGNSIRTTERLTGVHRDTIMRLSKRGQPVLISTAECPN